MSDLLTSNRRRMLLGAFAAGVSLGPLTSIGVAQQTRNVEDIRPHLPCGKARTLAARGFLPGMGPGPTATHLDDLSDTDVLHSALELEVSNLDPDNNTCLVTGRNTMVIETLAANLTEFTFRLRTHYTITNAYVNTVIPIAVNTPPHPNTTTRIAVLDRTYSSGETFALTVEYTGNSVCLPESIGSITVDTQPDDTPVVATLSQPYYAYSWWPVKEGDAGMPGDNTDKYTIELDITVPDNFTVPANGLLQVAETLPGNRKHYHWASNYPIAPSLVCFAATEYNTWTETYAFPGGTMPVEFYIYPTHDTPENRAAWEQSLVMLEVYGSLFGEYPFVQEKYGIYQFPFAGLEHQTMTGQGEEGGYWPFDEFLTAHELAHQWWGDAVTCKTWNHIWLNEGFASYADALWEEFKPGGALPALQSIMALRKSAIVPASDSVYVSDTECQTWGNIFDVYTSYWKGSWVLHMLRYMFGDEAFFDVLLAYRERFEYGAATTEDFQAVCEESYGASLEWFFQEWIYGRNSPEYRWGWNTTEVNGKHYLLVHVDQVQDPSWQRFTMPIDILADGTTHVVFNGHDPEYFVLPVSGAPTTVAFDPGEWILRADAIEETYVPGPPTVVETFPAPGDQIISITGVDAVTATFHTNVDVEETHFSLMGQLTGPRSFTIPSKTNVDTVTLSLGSSLMPDGYTLTVSDGVRASATGLALDGEVDDPHDPESLPSGDGVAGGDAVIRFTILAPIPTVSTWGLAVLALLLMACGAAVMRKRLATTSPAQ